MADPLDELRWWYCAFDGPGVYVCRIIPTTPARATVEVGAWVVTVLPDGRLREEGHNPRRVYPDTEGYREGGAAIEWVKVYD